MAGGFSSFVALGIGTMQLASGGRTRMTVRDLSVRGILDQAASLVCALRELAAYCRSGSRRQTVRPVRPRPEVGRLRPQARNGSGILRSWLGSSS